MTEIEKVEKAAAALLSLSAYSGNDSLRVMGAFTSAILQEKIEEDACAGLALFFNRMVTYVQDVAGFVEIGGNPTPFLVVMMSAIILRFPEQLVCCNGSEPLFFSTMKKRMIADNISKRTRTAWIWGTALGILAVLGEVSSGEINQIWKLPSSYSFASVVIAPFLSFLMRIKDIPKMANEAELSKSLLTLAKTRSSNFSRLVDGLASSFANINSDSFSEFGAQLRQEIAGRYWQSINDEEKWLMLNKYFKR